MLQSFVMKANSIPHNWLYGLLVLVIAVATFAGYKSYDLSQALEETKTLQQEQKSAYEDKIAGLEDTVEELRAMNENLKQALEEEENRNEEFAERIEEITGTVGQLEDFARTDPELLRKYSKVFFLSENYVPESLTIINEEYMYDEDKPVQVHSKVWSFLENLLEDAEDDDIDLKVVSGYRSFDTQANLKAGYEITYGENTANQFSAEQGYSEHQLGTTVDFTSPEEDQPFTTFAQTEAYAWLQDNAHKHGFVLSYPENNDYYIFEPWHWRFVGEELAEDLEEDNENFYDLPQREIDEYRADLFE